MTNKILSNRVRASPLLAFEINGCKGNLLLILISITAVEFKKKTSPCLSFVICINNYKSIP